VLTEFVEPNAAMEATWIEEAHRRWLDIESGRSEPIPWADVKDWLRKRRGHNQFVAPSA